LHPRWEIPGFDFSRDGVWRKRARQIAARRAAMLARRQFSALNARPVPGAGASNLVQGTFAVPVILFTYADSPVPAFDTAAYNAVLFGTTPPLGRPYTYRSFYRELSNGLLDIQGQSYGYAALDSNEVTYAGTPPCTGNPFPGSSNCNGLFDNFQNPGPVDRMQAALTEALSKLDTTIDWTQYDSDQNGYVDLVVFIQPAKDGACGGSSNNHLWSHRFTLGAPGYNGPEFTTHSPAPGGGFEKVRDYILQSALGGASACDSTSIMPIGTVAHETGHGFGLPDLYDTGAFTSSEGIGQWGLMGEGNYASPLSPARMEAWSLSELGWVTIVPVTAAGTHSVGAAPLADTAFYVRAQGANPRGEYFLLENRQRRQADSALIRIQGGGGLLVWHVDSQQIAIHGFNGDNAVNVGAIHGLALVQADGRGDLDAGRNRGDGGDPYPGLAANPSLALVRTPFPLKNSDGSFAGFSLDSIWQVAPDSTMAFRITFGSPMPAVQAVIDQLLTGTGLAPADQNYLDLSGNRNAQFDLGDFLAWVNAGNAP
jgi:immune inhibitor A